MVTSQNQTILYSMAALSDPDSPGQSTLQGYDIKNDNWQSISVTGGSFNQYDRYFSMHASSFEGGGFKSFISGGKDFLTGMVTLDASNPTQPSWENVTDPNIPYFFAGTTQYVRFGDAGVLVSVGGFITESTPQAVAQRREMNSIQIYDIAAKEWFTIFATGDAPPPRSHPCSALSAAPDDSSFNMIMHGGWNETDVQDDVYVLTMPAFHWIQINTTGSKPSYNPRLDHFCSTVHEDRQMLVLGGRQNFNDTGISCPNRYPAIRLLDTSTFTWQKNFPVSDTKYTVPQAIIDVIGGSPTGGAKSASVFSQTLGNHQTLFSKTIPRYDPDNPPKVSPTSPTLATTASPSAGSSSSTSATTSSTHLSGGAIAGIVIGALAGIALLGVAIWFLLLPFLRRRKLHRQNNGLRDQEWQQQQQPNTMRTEDDPNGYFASEMDGKGSPERKVSEIGGGKERVEAADGTPRKVFEMPADQSPMGNPGSPVGRRGK